jgi:hypothetical protein
MTFHLTAAQRHTATSIEVEVINHVQALGPAHAPAALRHALLAAPLSVIALRYLSRELDREADRRERERDPS